MRDYTFTNPDYIQEHNDFARNQFEADQYEKSSTYTDLYGISSEIPTGSNNGGSLIVVKQGFTDSTCAHELFHSMGLSHTFDPASEFVFEIERTDNIMDYSDIGRNYIKVLRSACWQWTIINPKLKGL